MNDKMKKNVYHNGTGNSSDLKDSRRKFLKKVVYSAPQLIVLGALLKPTNGWADGPPPPPGSGPVGPPVGGG